MIFKKSLDKPSVKSRPKKAHLPVKITFPDGVVGILTWLKIDCGDFDSRVFPKLLSKRIVTASNVKQVIVAVFKKLRITT